MTDNRIGTKTRFIKNTIALTGSQVGIKALSLVLGIFVARYLGATDYVTNIEFIEKIARIFKFDENLIREISFDEFFRNKEAPRTKFCWLDTLKFRKKFGNNILHTIDEGIMLFKENRKKLTLD